MAGKLVGSKVEQLDSGNNPDDSVFEPAESKIISVEFADKPGDFVLILVDLMILQPESMISLVKKNYLQADSASMPCDIAPLPQSHWPMFPNNSTRLQNDCEMRCVISSLICGHAAVFVGYAVLLGVFGVMSRSKITFLNK